MKTAKLLGIFCFIFALGGTVPLQAEISGARDVVVATIDDLYSGISGEFESDEMLRASIEQSLEQHLTPVLDLNKFTKLILAAHWKKASVEQRQRFTGNTESISVQDFNQGYYRTSTNSSLIQGRHYRIGSKTRTNGRACSRDGCCPKRFASTDKSRFSNGIRQQPVVSL